MALQILYSNSNIPTQLAVFSLEDPGQGQVTKPSPHGTRSSSLLRHPVLTRANYMTTPLPICGKMWSHRLSAGSHGTKTQCAFSINITTLHFSTSIPTSRYTIIHPRIFKGVLNKQCFSHPIVLYKQLISLHRVTK